jgi:hypothetical protein
MGDSDIFGDMALIAEIHQPKISLVPIGDRLTTEPELAALACRRLFQFDAVILCHYGSFPLVASNADASVSFGRLRERGLNGKRNLALREFALWTRGAATIRGRRTAAPRARMRLRRHRRERGEPLPASWRSPPVEEPGRSFNDLVTGIRSDVRWERRCMEGSQDLGMLTG